MLGPHKKHRTTFGVEEKGSGKWSDNEKIISSAAKKSPTSFLSLSECI
jgi:predicted oxidoreductase (fatty acid repression mutant protein)